MKRGEIYYANLNPAVGSEMAKRRPVLIVSNDVNNRAALKLHLALNWESHIMYFHLSYAKYPKN